MLEGDVRRLTLLFVDIRSLTLTSDIDQSSPCDYGYPITKVLLSKQNNTPDTDKSETNPDKPETNPDKPETNPDKPETNQRFDAEQRVCFRFVRVCFRFVSK